jgi:glyoxylase-like metal-dependent hydrolase (beta-lactamase superfamily II)/rhodanese-related sulfurtransferase
MSEYPEPDVPVESRSPADLAGALEAGEPVRLLDVRNRDEFESWHVDGPSVTHTLIPYMKWLQADAQDAVAERATEIEGEGPVVAVCGRGEASAYVAGLLSQAGIEAQNLAEGMEGWARVSQARTVRADPTVVQYRRPSSGCLGYLVVSGDEAVVVDPLRAFTDRYVADARERGAEVVAVLDTHVHADHVSGLRDLAAATGARRILPAPARERGVRFESETVADGEQLRVGSATIEAVGLPGHTTGMFGFVVGDVLLSGDSLFLDGLARPDLQDGPDPADLARELHATLTHRLGRFDDDTVLAPGHYETGSVPAEDGTYTAPLGEVRDRLAVFEESRQAFVERVTATEPPQPANADQIVAINLGRETASDDDAFELELGPNNCAAASVTSD